jgi:hypothetical protein
VESFLPRLRENVMHRDNPSTNSGSEILLPHALYRGLYVRVANRLGVDPSYVSRVARGERNSTQVENALRQDIQEISRKLGRRTASSEAASVQSADTGKRLKSVVKRNRTWIRQEWLRHHQSDRNSRKIRLSPRNRVSPVMPVVDEAVQIMKFSVREIPTVRMRAAEQHGRIRRAQKYTPAALVEDYNLIRRCITSLAEKHFSELDSHLLFHDYAHLDEVIDVQLQRALSNFLDVA